MLDWFPRSQMTSEDPDAVIELWGTEPTLSVEVLSTLWDEIKRLYVWAFRMRSVNQLELAPESDIA